MKNRKMKRIFSVVACVLVILTVLVLPISAQAALDPMPSSVVDAYSAFYDYMPDRMKTLSYSFYANDVHDTYLNNAELSWQEYILSSTTLSSGSINPIVIGYPFRNDETYLMWTDRIDWCLEVNNQFYIAQDSYAEAFFSDGRGRVTFSYYISTTSCRLDIKFNYADFNDSGVVQGEITTVEYYVGSAAEPAAIYMVSDIESMSLTLANHYDTGADDGDDGFVAMISNLLFIDSRNNVRSPYSYYYGYSDGFSTITEGEAYKRGYDDAVKNIDSGEFGKNILGGVLASPYEFLRKFVLIEWQLADGVEVVVTLATVVSAAIGISLFIWFLKMFAGG